MTVLSVKMLLLLLNILLALFAPKPLKHSAKLLLHLADLHSVKLKTLESSLKLNKERSFQSSITSWFQMSRNFLLLDTGVDKRTIVSGIAQHYSAEEMVGKQVTLIANLAPRKVCF